MNKPPVDFALIIQWYGDFPQIDISALFLVSAKRKTFVKVPNKIKITVNRSI